MNDKTKEIINYIREHSNVSNKLLMEKFGGTSERFTNIRRRHKLPADPTRSKTHIKSTIHKYNEETSETLHNVAGGRKRTKHVSESSSSIYQSRDLYPPDDNLESIWFVYYILTGKIDRKSIKEKKKIIKQRLNLN